MSYYINLNQISLAEFHEKIQNEYLIPSHRLLRENSAPYFSRFENLGIETLQQLLDEIKTKSKLSRFSAKSGVSEEYLTILRREINRFLPSPVDIDKFPGTPAEVIECLKSVGIKTSLQLFDKTLTPRSRQALALELHIEDKEMLRLVKLSNLVRVKWLSAVFAVLLYESGFDTLDKISASSGSEILSHISQINQEKHIYGGRFGENDMALLVQVAKDVPRSTEL